MTGKAAELQAESSAAVGQNSRAAGCGSACRGAPYYLIQHLQKAQMRLRMQGRAGGRHAKDHAEADRSVKIKKTES